MMMALGLRLTAQPRCTLGCMIDGEKGGRGRRKSATEGEERAERDLARGGEKDEKEGRKKVTKVVKRWRAGRRKEAKKGERGRVEGKPEQEIEISRYDRSGRDSRGQTERVEGE